MIDVHHEVVTGDDGRGCCSYENVMENLKTLRQINNTQWDTYDIMRICSCLNAAGTAIAAVQDNNPS